MTTRSAGAAAAPRRRGRPRADEAQITQDQVLGVSLRAFAAKGYHGMSVRDLNKELGVSHNLIHRRFGSKAKLWEATVDRWFVEFTDQLDPVLDSILPGEPLEAFRAFIVAFIVESAAKPDLLRMTMVEAATDGPRLDYLWERHLRPFGQRVRRVVSSLEGSERYVMVPQGTMFFLLAHGAIAPASHRPLALKLDRGEEPTAPAALHRHANAVADLLLGVDPTIRLRSSAAAAKRRRRGEGRRELSAR
jgi:AcrR family transcriptional regulator